jgi:hypothetical protein
MEREYKTVIVVVIYIYKGRVTGDTKKILEELTNDIFKLKYHLHFEDEIKL